MQALQNILNEDRASLSPSKFSEEDFEEFQDQEMQPGREADTVVDIVPVIAGSADVRLRKGREVLYSNAAPIVPEVKFPKPDKLYGASASQIAVHVRRDIGSHIMPSKSDSPFVPNFTMEAKSKSGNADVVQRQAVNNGAFGARAMHSLQNYGWPAVYDNKAYALGATYHDGQLKVYATHPVQASEDACFEKEYYTTQLNSYAMTGTRAEFRQGATAYRNARDWAQARRDEIIECANNRFLESAVAPSRQSHCSQSTRISALESSDDQDLRISSDTSADELLGPNTPIKRQRRRPHQRSLHPPAQVSIL